jgi:hypothetical protein
VTLSDEFAAQLDELGRTLPGANLSAEQSVARFIASDIYTGLHLMEGGAGGYVEVEVDGQTASRALSGN